MIKESLYTYIRKLLVKETYTNKQVAEVIAIGENVVKDVDKKRL